MSARETMWLDAERLGEHVHVKVSTGYQLGQDDEPHYRGGEGYRNNAGGAGTLILRADQWPPYIRALAVGGHATGLRVVWRLTPDDGRYLWNGLPDAPCITDSHDPEPWTRTPPREHELNLMNERTR